MKIMQVLTVFLLLGLSTSALAKGPWGEKDQVLVTPALWGDFIELTILNKSGGDVHVTFDHLNNNGIVSGGGSSNLADGTATGSGTQSQSALDYYKVYWYGHPHDLIVTICATDIDIIDGTRAKGCLKAN